jgi:heme exporter protein D
MLPTVMMGSFIGVIMNAAMPDLILQVCLTLLLAFLTVQSAFKAREILKKENEKLRAKKKVEKEKKRESNRILGIEETDEVKEDKDLNWEDNSNSTDPSFITTNSIVVTNNTGNKDTIVTSPKAENEISSPKQ